MNFQSQLRMVSEDVFFLVEMGGDKSTDYSRLSFPGAKGSVCGHVAIKLGISIFERFRLSRWGWFNFSEMTQAPSLPSPGPKNAAIFVSPNHLRTSP